MWFKRERSMFPPQFLLEDISHQIYFQLLYATISYYFIKKKNYFRFIRAFLATYYMQYLHTVLFLRNQILYPLLNLQDHIQFRGSISNALDLEKLEENYNCVLSLDFLTPFSLYCMHSLNF